MSQNDFTVEHLPDEYTRKAGGRQAAGRQGDIPDTGGHGACPIPAEMEISIIDLLEDR